MPEFDNCPVETTIKVILKPWLKNQAFCSSTDLLCFLNPRTVHSFEWTVRFSAIESTFATLRHRTIAVKGAFSKETAMAMMFQLGLEAEKSWRRITGSERLAEVIKGVRFIDGEAQALVG